MATWMAVVSWGLRGRNLKAHSLLTLLKRVQGKYPRNTLNKLNKNILKKKKRKEKKGGKKGKKKEERRKERGEERGGEERRGAINAGCAPSLPINQLQHKHISSQMGISCSFGRPPVLLVADDGATEGVCEGRGERSGRAKGGWWWTNSGGGHRSIRKRGGGVLRMRIAPSGSP